MKCPYCKTEIKTRKKLESCPICGEEFYYCPTCKELQTVKTSKCLKDGTPIPDEIYEKLPYEEFTYNEYEEEDEVTLLDPNDSEDDTAGRVMTGTAADKGAAGAGKGSRKGGGSQGGKGKLILGGIIAVLLLVGVIEGGLLLKGNASKKQETASNPTLQSAEPNDDWANKGQTDKEVEIEEEKEEASAQKAEEEKPAGEEDKIEETKTEEEPIEAYVDYADYSLLSSLSKARVSTSWASSVVQDNQAGINNEPEMMVDGNEITSWQEGAPGDGTGEKVKFTLDEKSKVKCITFKMGNWRDQTRYDENYRPKKVKLKVGTESFTLTFPNGKDEFMVEFSRPISAKEISLEIKSTYQGSRYREWQDCCISEMTVYKK